MSVEEFEEFARITSLDHRGSVWDIMASRYVRPDEICFYFFPDSVLTVLNYCDFLNVTLFLVLESVYSTVTSLF